MKRVRTPQLFLCNRHLAERLPISGRATIHLEAELGCQMSHPDLEQVLEEAVREIAEARPVHA